MKLLPVASTVLACTVAGLFLRANPTETVTSGRALLASKANVVTLKNATVINNGGRVAITASDGMQIAAYGDIKTSSPNPRGDVVLSKNGDSWSLNRFQENEESRRAGELLAIKRTPGGGTYGNVNNGLVFFNSKGFNK